MKALMFGWEFPPHILGGLGTASYGLTRGMAEQPDMHITFVIRSLGAMRISRSFVSSAPTVCLLYGKMRITIT